MNLSATYDPTDNKLRLRSDTRLPRDLYDRLKAEGFSWAPKQGLFYAPAWSPDREDLLIELCGEIGDEDTSLVDRADERAERFDGYRERREEDAEDAKSAVDAIVHNIPMGQPILVGHHSERHARKDAQRIENGMRRAIQMWETAEYWKHRAAGAIRHAKYKERADVRARRIKGIEADKKKQERTKAEAAKFLSTYNDPEAMGMKLRDGRKLIPALIATYEGGLSLDDQVAFERGEMPFEVAFEKAKSSLARRIARCDRWITHFDNRLLYERAMLEEQGGTVTDRKGPEKGGACRCWASPGHGQAWSYIQKVNKVSVTILDNWGNGGPNFTRTVPFDDLKAIMTAQEVERARQEGRISEDSAKIGFFLDPPKTEAKEEEEGRPSPEQAQEQAPAAPAADRRKKGFESMKKALKDGGVKVAVVPQLFPTPPKLATKMAELAEIEPGHRILEPSAGTGNLLTAIAAEHTCAYEMHGGVCSKPSTEKNEPKDCRACKTGTLQAIRGKVHITAVEIDHKLRSILIPAAPSGTTIMTADFLSLSTSELGTFDRVIMNPPFQNGADIKHIRHAFEMLKPGGRLVALCANGPRQIEAFMSKGCYWEELPEGTFREEGTDVRVALLILDRENAHGGADAAEEEERTSALSLF